MLKSYEVIPMRNRLQKTSTPYIGATLFIATLLALSACSTGSSTAPAPNPIQRGQWVRTAFPGVTPPTLSAVAFADTDQRVGYACAAQVSQSSGATPTTTATVAATTSTPAATSTPGLPGQPTTAPGQTNFANSFLRTNDGGLTWQKMTLPVNQSNLLCPISAIVAPDLTNTSDVFFLAAFGTLDLSQPTGIAPGAIHYQLWRSNDGGQTWSQLTVPTEPNPITPAIIDPYHLVIMVKGQAITLASNFSGADLLFASDDGGKTWNLHNNPDLAQRTSIAANRVFAGFAAGPDGSLYALETSPSQLATTTPYQLWKSTDGGTTWHTLNGIDLGVKLGSDAHVQIFIAPEGQTIYLIAHSDQATSNGSTTPQPATVTLRSTDGGGSWTTLTWPSNSNTPLGAATIATLGENFAVDAAGNAYVAPTKSDLPLSQDAHAQESGGFYDAAAGGDWKSVAQPKSSGATSINLAVSMTVLPSTSGTATPTGTASATETPAVTATATGATTPTATTTGTPAPTTASTPVATNGVPTLWTNFGPVSQLAQQPDATGFFENILP